MKVLQANKFFYARGGAERYFLDLTASLRDAGHEVVPFSMKHPENQTDPHDIYFVSEIDYNASAGLSTPALAARTIYNCETKSQLSALLRTFRPDVAHLHNIHHQLTGALIESLHREGIPIVQTLHDYQWACPVYTFVSHGEVCEACRGGRYLEAVRRKCHRGSRAKSLVAAMELMVGRVRGWANKVDRFLAPSEFMAAKMIEHGLPKDRVVHQDYALPVMNYRPSEKKESFALYAGRLSHEKGIETLLQALAHHPTLHLKIAGTGPLEAHLRKQAETTAPGRVEFLGYLQAEALQNQAARAAFIVVPSEWYENQPFAVLEAFALSTPVLGARIGGIPELVQPGKTGELFESGSVASLSEGLGRMMDNPRVPEMGRAARRFLEDRFRPEPHVLKMEQHYREVAS